MRTRHWLAALMGGCMAFAGLGTAHAQPPMMPSNGNPDLTRTGMLPAPYSTSYGPMQPGYPGMNSPGYPPGGSAWPGVSPFAGPPVDSTTYENGFWYNMTRQGSRQYYFQAEVLLSHAHQPSSALIGAPNVNPQTQDSITGNTGGGGTTTNTALGATQFNQSTSATGPSRSITGGGNGGGNGGSTGSPVIFGSLSTGILPDDLFSNGIRGSWGWFNPDDTGFVVSGFALNRTTSSYGLVDSQLNLDPNSQNYNPLLHLHAWFGLPLAGADTDNTSFNQLAQANDGAVIPYDMSVRFAFSTRLAGANTDWYFNPVYEGQSFKLRPLGGARYIRLQENFLFDAYDSGLAYTVASSSTGGGGGGGTTGTATSGFLSPSALTTPFNTPNILHSRLDSATLSNMAGPEIGLRLDLGGKKFQLWAQTKVGLLANVTERRVSGYGIGNNFNITNSTTAIGTVNTVPVMPNDPSRTGFNNSQTTTTMTPMFEQQFNIKMPVFNLVPYLNKLEAFEKASLTAGYTFLYLQDVYRPHNSIAWNQYPNTPQLTNQKSNYYTSLFNVGVEWQY